MLRPRLFGLACLFMLLLLGGCSTLSGQNLKGVPPRDLTASEGSELRALFTTPKRIALLIGIDTFDDSHWNTLQFAVKDANDMAAVLNDTCYGQFDEVIALTSSEETTRANILAAVHDLSSRNISAEDTVLFYISTHGTLARTEDGKLHQYLVARDTRMDDIPATAIDVTQLKREISQVESQKKVMVIASCHSGKGKSQLGKNMLAEMKVLKSQFFVKPLDSVSEATVVLAASAWEESAREDVNLKNDVYTHFLIEGIKKNDRNNDGAVTVTEAHDYAKQQTYYYTKGEQRPSVESVITGADPIVLSGKVVRNGKPVLYDYSRRFENMVVFVDGQKKGSLPLGIALEPGAHNVELRSADETRLVYSENFRAAKGEQVSLPLLINGYDQGTSFRVGYQGFLADKADAGISKPLVMYGLAYSNHAYFSPRLGYRLDLSYGNARQTLTVDKTAVSADVSQTAFGASLLYRVEEGGMSLYGGPRVGELIINRKLNVDKLGAEKNSMPTIGGIAGLHFRYKKQVSLSLEAAVNYTKIEIGATSTNSFFYNLFGNLSVNF